MGTWKNLVVRDHFGFRKCFRRKSKDYFVTRPFREDRIVLVKGFISSTRFLGDIIGFFPMIFNPSYPLPIFVPMIFLLFITFPGFAIIP